MGGKYSTVACVQHCAGSICRSVDLPGVLETLNRTTAPSPLARTSPTCAPQDLAAWNERYEAKFGHIFIVCASGKSAQEMLAAVQQR